MILARRKGDSFVGDLITQTEACESSTVQNVVTLMSPAAINAGRVAAIG